MRGRQKSHQCCKPLCSNAESCFEVDSLRGYCVGVTDQKDLWCTPLRWPQVTWYIHIRFHEEYKHPSNIMVLPQQFEWLMLVLLMDWCHEVCHWDELRWHYIHTKFHDYWFRHVSNITVITATIREAAVLVQLVEGIYKVCCWYGLVRSDTHTKFHED
jgi:hypothetical protein